MSNTTHLRPSGSAKTLCGRPAKTRRVHRSWPTCKTCKRIAATSGGVTFWFFDADGWLINAPERLTCRSGTVTVSWVRP